jgi:putative membrane protein insertion efficiency factor
VNWKQRAALLVIRAYQLALSPFMGGACRFHPSCSEYAFEAIAAHGAARGCWLAMRRLARCHPFSRAGVDPVPAKGRS